MEITAPPAGRAAHECEGGLLTLQGGVFAPQAFAAFCNGCNSPGRSSHSDTTLSIFHQ
jgi:hypothetical protein